MRESIIINGLYEFTVEQVREKHRIMHFNRRTFEKGAAMLAAHWDYIPDFATRETALEYMNEHIAELM